LERNYIEINFTYSLT